MTDKYAVIDAEKANYPVTKMCRWLEVSRSGFYEWLGRLPSAAARRRAGIAALVAAVFKHSRGTYGARRIAAMLARNGETVGVRLVAKVMDKLGLIACQPRPYKRTTVAGSEPAAIPDLVNRDFTAAAPGTKLVGDITYIRTWTGWLYLATVLDCYSHRVIGWSMATHMRTSLIVDAIEMAKVNTKLAEGAIFHSDRGSQYTSEQFRAVLAGLEIKPSMGRTGVCWDNAMAESFFAALKNELVYRTVFPTQEHARRAIAEYIEVFYNRQRIHSTLGYRTPLEVEVGHQESLQAA